MRSLGESFADVLKQQELINLAWLSGKKITPDSSEGKELLKINAELVRDEAERVKEVLNLMR
jgi:hypothetical protein